MTFSEISRRCVCKRGELVFCQKEIAVGAHDAVGKQVGVMRSQDHLRVRHFFKDGNNAFGKLVMIKSVEFINEHEGYVSRSLYQ